MDLWFILSHFIWKERFILDYLKGFFALTTSEIGFSWAACSVVRKNIALFICNTQKVAMTFFLLVIIENILNIRTDRVFLNLDFYLNFFKTGSQPISVWHLSNWDLRWSDKSSKSFERRSQRSKFFGNKRSWTSNSLLLIHF